MSDLVVFDTNAFVSYFWPSVKISAARISVDRMMDGKAIPVFSTATMSEYVDVLNRKKFNFSHHEICCFLDSIIKNGYRVSPVPTLVHFTDASDKCFYDAAVAAGCWLVTGNKRHYPDEPFVVSPREWLNLLGL